ncbi:MAG: helix-turn-helix transcriptional regulator [Erysipelotrichales bacterium]|nr:helix-turn-helix transcriptional regulator [Erysipelotrichales bacterium]
MTLAEQIVKIREENNLTQEQFAESLFVTRQAVSKWERGVSIPDIETLRKISITYKISLNILLGTINKVKSSERKVLAQRSQKMIGFMIFGMILSLIGLIFTIPLILNNDFKKVDNMFSLMVYLPTFAFLITFILALILFIRDIRKPKIIIEYNDFGIFLLSHNDKFIAYEDIVSCNAKFHHAGRYQFQYSFGNLIIVTKTDNIKVGTIADLDRVKSKLIELKTQNTIVN